MPVGELALVIDCCYAGRAAQQFVQEMAGFGTNVRAVASCLETQKSDPCSRFMRSVVRRLGDNEKWVQEPSLAALGAALRHPVALLDGSQTTHFVKLHHKSKPGTNDTARLFGDVRHRMELLEESFEPFTGTREAVPLCPDFVGRKHVFDALDVFLGDAEASSTLLLVTGGSGTGKTTWAREAVSRNPDTIHAVHYCRFNLASTLDPLAWMESIANQIYHAGWGSNSEQVRSFVSQIRKPGAQLVPLFKAHMTSVLSSSAKSDRKRVNKSSVNHSDGLGSPGLDVVAVLVDGIDELRTGGGDEGARHALILQAISATVGLVADGGGGRVVLKYVLTAQSLLEEDLGKDCDTMLVSLEDGNGSDVREWVRNAKAKPEWLTDQDASGLLDRLAQAAGNNFQFARFVLQEAKSKEQLVQLLTSAPPKGLLELYSARMREAWTLEGAMKLRPLLDVLVAAASWLPVSLLLQAAAWLGLDTSDQEMVQDALDFLQRLLVDGTAALDPYELAPGKVLLLAHHSWRDWLIHPGYYSREHLTRVTASPTRGHWALSKAGLDTWHELEYATQYTTFHWSSMNARGGSDPQLVGQEIPHSALVSMVTNPLWVRRAAVMGGFTSMNVRKVFEEFGGEESLSKEAKLAAGLEAALEGASKVLRFFVRVGHGVSEQVLQSPHPLLQRHVGAAKCRVLSEYADSLIWAVQEEQRQGLGAVEQFSSVLAKLNRAWRVLETVWRWYAGQGLEQQELECRERQQLCSVLMSMVDCLTPSVGGSGAIQGMLDWTVPTPLVAAEQIVQLASAVPGELELAQKLHELAVYRLRLQGLRLLREKKYHAAKQPLENALSLLTLEARTEDAFAVEAVRCLLARARVGCAVVKVIRLPVAGDEDDGSSRVSAKLNLVVEQPEDQAAIMIELATRGVKTSIDEHCSRVPGVVCCLRLNGNGWMPLAASTERTL